MNVLSLCNKRIKKKSAMSVIMKTPSVAKTINIPYWYITDKTKEFDLKVELIYHWELSKGSADPVIVVENLKLDGVEMPTLCSIAKLHILLHEDIFESILNELELEPDGFYCEYLSERTYKGFQIYDGYFVHPYEPEKGFITVKGNDELMDEINEM